MAFVNAVVVVVVAMNQISHEVKFL
jgi:hypothetical protein